MCWFRLRTRHSSLALPEDVIERVDVVFYGDVDRAVLKTLEI